ncbi:hypothetical protein EZS27_016176 [termite gut metagenome]|uniref:Uncharacterized protein n=1 Tax=termite gut metagenome TaxID=433724 RepID=A0A5J4RPM9_9ZZZZ
MNRANYTGHVQQNFPLSTAGLDFIQQQIFLAAQYAKSAGGNYILTGCEEAGNEVNPGILIIAGEIMPFTGGVKQTKIRITEVHEDVTAGIETYTDAYVKRFAEFGTNLSDVDTFLWSDFTPFPANPVDYVDSIVLSQGVLLKDPYEEPEDTSLSQLIKYGKQVTLNLLLYMTVNKGYGEVLATLPAEVVNGKDKIVVLGRYNREQVIVIIRPDGGLYVSGTVIEAESGVLLSITYYI